MTPPQIRVALVGYGFAGKVFHAPLIAAVDGLVLDTVVSQRPRDVHADLPGARVAASLDEVCDDATIDLVVIATPNIVHAAQADRALRAGRHVVVDKPFTVTVADAEQVIATAAEHDRLLSVFHNRRWDADFRTTSQLITDGTLGDIVQFESHFDRFRLEVRDRWRERAAPGAGLWYDLGPHLLDQAVLLFGMPIGISADFAIQRIGGVTDDYFHVTLRYERLRVLLHASTLVADNARRFAVHGTGGSFVKHGMDPQEAALKAGLSPRADRWGVDPNPGSLTQIVGGEAISTVIGGLPGAYGAYYEGIRDAIWHGTANPVPAVEALQVMRLVEAGCASANTRSEVLLG
jgi:predicted dehydrogenase